MDLNDLCITLVLVNCLWMLALRPGWAWSIKALAVLGLLGGTWWWRPAQAGWVTLGPFLVLIALPFWLLLAAQQALHQRRFRSVWVMSTVLAMLHPDPRVKHMRRMLRVLPLFFRGQIADGLAIARRAGIDDVWLRNLAAVLDAQMSGLWEPLIAGFPRQGWEDPNILVGRLQASAECGDGNAFVQTCEVIAQSEFTAERSAVLHLRAFAILGEVDTVSKILLGHSSLIAKETREFWQAVAERNSGASPSAEDRLNRLRGIASESLRPMVERWWLQPSMGQIPAEARARAGAALSETRAVIDHDHHFAVLATRSLRWPVMTYALGLALLAVFLVEVPGGSEDVDNLVRLGALQVPLTGEPGEWQRMLTCGFLHVGPIHLALNLLGLWILGGRVERAWGALAMLLQFLICLIVSSSLLPWVTPMNLDEPSVFAGASGGIMGLLGGLWGHLAVGRFRKGTPLVRHQFRVACVFIVMQSLCDALTPQVSMTCHLIGLATGMILGVLLGLWRSRRVSPRAD